MTAARRGGGLLCPESTAGRHEFATGAYLENGVRTGATNLSRPDGARTKGTP